MIKFFLFGFKAQGSLGEYRPPEGLPSGDTDLSSFFVTATDNLLLIAGSIAALLLIFGGIQYALAAGDEEKQMKAKRTVKWTIVGLVIALAAYGIVLFLTKLLG